MHPRIDYPGELASILADISRPLHDTCLRDFARVAEAGSEVSLAAGYRLDTTGAAHAPHLDALKEDWHQFMEIVMDTGHAEDGFPIRLSIHALEGVPEHAAEAYRIVTGRERCEVTARDTDGLRRGLFRLQDEMRLRRAPILPVVDETRWAAVRTRISRSPIAPYRWLSGWELEDGNDYYPEEYLRKLAHCGVNGIWVSGLLRNLVASRVIPELGPPAHRLEKLRHLVERATRYGIRVYFFGIEPRALPLDHPAGAAHPEIIGSRNDLWGMLCPSTPLVLDYLREVMRELFTAAPGLGGIVNIFCGERPTSCGWDESALHQCPRCSQVGRSRTLSSMLNAMNEGIRAAAPDAEMIAWTYTITRDRETAPMGPMQETMQQCDPEIIWLANFEHGGVKPVCGKPHVIHEYALSYTGPSEPFRQLAAEVLESGRRVYAKLQLGTSAEMASVPYIPVPGIVYDKLMAMQGMGVTGSFLTWMFGGGGYPGCMLKAAGEAAFEPVGDREAFLRRLAGIEWGEKAAERVAAAWECFGAAWQHYPFDIAVLYWGPVTRAPAYHLHLERETRTTRLYNFGLERTREPQWWTDEPERWSGALPIRSIIEAFRTLAGEWSRGVESLRSLAADSGAPDELRRQAGVAEAIRLQSLSTANVYAFYALRDQLTETDEPTSRLLVQRLLQTAEDEIRVAEAMIPLMENDPYLGFFSELYARVYSIPMVREKVRQVRGMIATLRRWEQTGVEQAVLRRTVAEADKQRPERWGD